MRKYFFWAFSFLKPYMPAYIIGIFLYSSQMFGISFINALLLSQSTAATLNGDVRGILTAAGVFLALFAVYFVFISAGIVLYNNAEMKATRELKKQLFRRFVRRGVEKSQSAHSGEGIAAINTDADNAVRLYDAVSPFISCLITIVFSSAVVFAIDYRLGAASVLIGFLALLIQSRFAKPLGKIGEEQLAANAESVKEMSDIMAGAMPLRVFNAQQRVLARFDRPNQLLKSLSYRQAFISTWQSLFTTVQGWLSMFGVFALGGYLVATGRLSFPVLMMVPTMCESLAAAMSSIGAAYAGTRAPLAAAKRVFDILDETDGITEKGEAKGKSEITEKDEKTGIAVDTYKGGGEAPLSGNIVLSHINFAYANAPEPSLFDINLTVEANKMTAIVGESGSGKSTLLRLITGLYERGDIDMSINGLRYTTDGITEWRKRFAFVDQSCKLFDMSVAENIALGLPGAPKLDAGTREAVKEAARAAFADGFIEALPEQYDAQCGEKGASLSGGQKQRIVIARALIRKAPVLVFDEATSALDAETERGIMETINNLRGSHTILITTHQLKSVINADTIIVMDKGRVAEKGRHDELLARDGVYKRMYARDKTQH